MDSSASVIILIVLGVQTMLYVEELLKGDVNVVFVCVYVIQMGTYGHEALRVCAIVLLTKKHVELQTDKFALVMETVYVVYALVLKNTPVLLIVYHAMIQ